MPRFRVIITELHSRRGYVEADTPEQAIKKAEELDSSDGTADWPVEFEMSFEPTGRVMDERATAWEVYDEAGAVVLNGAVDPLLKENL